MIMLYQIVMGLLLYIAACCILSTPKMRVITIVQEETAEIIEIEIPETHIYKCVEDSDTFLEYFDIVTNTTKQLKQWAREEGIKRYGSARKQELIRALMV